MHGDAAQDESPNAVLMQALTEVHSGQQLLVQQMQSLMEASAKQAARIEEIAKGFPDNDVEGHRRYHQSMIELVAEKRRLRIAIQEKTISGLIWAAMVFMGMSAFYYTKAILTGAPVVVK